VPEDGLVEKIAGLTKGDQSREVFLKADRNVPYGIVVRIMGALMSSGITNLNIITNPQEESVPGR
jgi:biopolymer transport protein TolR